MTFTLQEEFKKCRYLLCSMQRKNNNMCLRSPITMGPCISLWGKLCSGHLRNVLQLPERLISETTSDHIGASGDYVTRTARLTVLVFHLIYTLMQPHQSCCSIHRHTYFVCMYIGLHRIGHCVRRKGCYFQRCCSKFRPLQTTLVL